MNARLRGGVTVQGGTSTGPRRERHLRPRHRQPEPVRLPQGVSVPDRDSRHGDLHGAQDRRAAERHDAEPSRARDHRALERAGQRHCAVARPCAGWRRREHPDQHPDRRRALRRPDDAGRHARRQAAAVRPHAHQRRARHLQPVQLERAARPTSRPTARRGATRSRCSMRASRRSARSSISNARKARRRRKCGDI